MRWVRSGWDLDHCPRSEHSYSLEPPLPVSVQMPGVSFPGDVEVPPEGSVWEQVSPEREVR